MKLEEFAESDMSCSHKLTWTHVRDIWDKNTKMFLHEAYCDLPSGLGAVGGGDGRSNGKGGCCCASGLERTG